MKLLGLAFCLVFAFLLVPQLVFAGEMCPICDGQVGKQRCLDNSCQTSCYPIGIMCNAGEGHCANGACSKNCCAGQTLADGQICTNDTITGTATGQTIICLDPGHVPTANNIQEGVSENDNAFNVSVLVKKKLEGFGYKVVTTKTSASSKKTPDGLTLEDSGGCVDTEGIRNRSRSCKAQGANYMFSIHSDLTGSGPYVIAPPKPSNGCKPNTTNEYYNRNLKYARVIQATMATVLKGAHSANANGVVIEGNGYTNCNKANPKCWQLNATAGAINEDLDKGLVEMTPDPSWYKENIDLASEAIAKGLAAAVPKDLGGANGGAAELLKKACEYVKSPDKYKKDMMKDFTDCWGFVATALKTSVDPGINPGNIGVAEYCSGDALVKRKPNLYEGQIPIKSTKDLKPGDIVFDNSGCGDGTGHAIIYTGPDWCGCSGNTASASLGSHGPECSNWYSTMNRAYRLKK